MPLLISLLSFYPVGPGVYVPIRLGGGLIKLGPCVVVL